MFSVSFFCLFACFVCLLIAAMPLLQSKKTCICSCARAYLFLCQQQRAAEPNGEKPSVVSSAFLLHIARSGRRRSTCVVSTEKIEYFFSLRRVGRTQGDDCCVCVCCVCELQQPGGLNRPPNKLKNQIKAACKRERCLCLWLARLINRQPSTTISIDHGWAGRSVGRDGGITKY